MSKTYRKNVRANNACGDNREFYKNRRSKFKTTSKQDFRNLLANHDIDEVNDMILEPKQPKKDMRKEPTDGHYLLNKDTLKAYDRENGYNDYYHKFDKVLKNKH